MTEGIPVLYDEYAWVYDLAYSWCIDDEIEWLLEKLGPVRHLIEPGCGSARMFPAFLQRGISMAGIDISASMIEQARARLRNGGFPEQQLVVSDISSFELTGIFDGAICPVGTLGYLDPEAGRRHLNCLARYLNPGAHYLVQLGLRNADNFQPPSRQPHWHWQDEEHGASGVCSWRADRFDVGTRVLRSVARIEIASGPDAGTMIESEHHSHVWGWDDWSAVIAASPFEQAGAYDGDGDQREPLPVSQELEGQQRTWHYLIRQ